MIELKEIYSEDNVNLVRFIPPRDGFILSIVLEIGFTESKGQDIFRFTLCDINGFNNYLLKYDEDFGKNGILCLNLYNIILLNKYSYESVINKINKIIKESFESCITKEWREIAERLSKYFYWEYENDSSSS